MKIKSGTNIAIDNNAEYSAISVLIIRLKAVFLGMGQPFSSY
jgi:hypothetical protein